MESQPVAVLMAREATRRRLTEPPLEPSPGGPRRAAARVLQAAAHRLDPCVPPPPRARLNRA
jgi:hypothetical protein